MAQNYIFGYGSLVSAQDVERTLGHPPQSLIPTTLNGWVRDWSIILDNTTTTRRYETLPERTVPHFVAILNIHQPRSGENATNPNGVLFPVSDEEMSKMDSREKHYHRIDVTADIIDKPDGKVYTYVGMDEFLETPALRQQAVLPKSYLDLVEQGFQTFGQDSLNRFRASTIKSEAPIQPTIHTSNV